MAKEKKIEEGPGAFSEEFNGIEIGFLSTTYIETLLKNPNWKRMIDDIRTRYYPSITDAEKEEFYKMAVTLMQMGFMDGMKTSIISIKEIGALQAIRGHGIKIKPAGEA